MLQTVQQFTMKFKVNIISVIKRTDFSYTIIRNHVRFKFRAERRIHRFYYDWCLLFYYYYFLNLFVAVKVLRM